MNQTLLDLTKYVNAGADLAESVAADIEAGREISDNTVLALSKFAVAARAVSNLIDTMDGDSTKLQ